MSLAIRRVSLAQDREEMIALLIRNFGPIQEERFAWRHIENPAGVCWSWFAFDSNGSSHKAPVALVTVFPRNMRVGRERVRGGQVGEFAVDATHRSLGPAVQLQKITFSPVDSGDLAFCYDCTPHDRGMSTFVRLGMRPNCRVNRYALPLRCDPYVAKKLGTGAWTKPLVAAGNVLLRARRARRSAEELEIQEFQSPFGEEFDQLDDDVPSTELIRASRAAQDLNWRYRADPMSEKTSASGASGTYHTIVARRRGELMAFAVFFVQSDGITSIVDIFGREFSETGPALLDAVIDTSKKLNVSSIYACCSEQGELMPVLLRAGFRERERTARVVAYTRKNGPKPFDADLRWSFTQVEVML
jgi:hypothetical protein